MAAQIVNQCNVYEKKDLINTLMLIIMNSKNNNQLAQASSNAITILNFIDYKFFNIDFQDIHIPFANLEQASLQHVNFRKANLQGVIFNAASMYGAVLDESNLLGSKFGITPDLLGHKGGIITICCSPNQKQIISSSNDKSIKIWCLENFNEDKNIQIEQIDNEVNTICCSQDEKYFFTGYQNSSIIVWNLKQFQIVNKIDKAHNNRAVNTLCCSPDGKYLISGSQDKTIKLWSILDNFKEIKTLQGHNNWVRCVCTSIDSKYLFSGSNDKTIKVWALKAKNDEQKTISDQDNQILNEDNKQQKQTDKEDLDKIQLIKTLIGHQDYVTTICCQAKVGKYLISGSDDNLIKIWSIGFQQEDDFIEIKSIQGHEAAIYSICSSIDGKYIFSGGIDTKIKVWSTESFAEVKTLTGHTQSISSLNSSLDGKYLISGSDDASIKLWNLDSLIFEETKTNQAGHSQWISSICFSNDNRFLISGSADSTIKIWDIINENCVEVQTLYGHTDAVLALCLTEDGKFLISGSKDEKIKVWSIQENPITLVRTLEGHLGYVTVVLSFIIINQNKSNNFLASGSEDRTVKIWNLDTFAEIFRLESHTELIKSICISLDKNYLFTGSFDKKIKVWNLLEQLQKNEKYQDNQNNQTNSNSITNNPTNDINQNNQYVILQEIFTLEQHQDDIYSICCSPNGKFLASCSGDTTIKIWLLPQYHKQQTSNQDDNDNWKVVTTLQGHTDSVIKLCYSMNGQFLISGSWDYTIKIWCMETYLDYQQYTIVKTLKAHQGIVEALTFSIMKSGEQLLVSGGSDKALIIWQFNESNQKQLEIKQKMRIMKQSSLQLSCISFQNLVQIDEVNNMLFQQKSISN